mmetsp:Transcript_41509/g.89143  ORF Transcript_41509/g.89143 Transcript_41509/m.89143 type:complete len:230 (-) Transcript_41509:240-929(-)
MSSSSLHVVPTSSFCGIGDSRRSTTGISGDSQVILPPLDRRLRSSLPPPPSLPLVPLLLPMLSSLPRRSRSRFLSCCLASWLSCCSACPALPHPPPPSPSSPPPPPPPLCCRDAAKDEKEEKPLVEVVGGRCPGTEDGAAAAAADAAADVEEENDEEDDPPMVGLWKLCCWPRESGCSSRISSSVLICFPDLAICLASRCVETAGDGVSAGGTCHCPGGRRGPEPRWPG